MVFRPVYKPPGSSASWSMKWLDGDYTKVSLIDTSPDGGMSISEVSTSHFLAGRPIKPDHMPTMLYPTKKVTKYPDYFTYGGAGLVVSEKFRSVVESLEPDRHQFFPIKIMSKSKKNHLADMFIMIICNRLDTVHAEKTNRYFHRNTVWRQRAHNREDPNRLQWKGKDRLVIDSSKIGDHHLWFDKHLNIMDGPLMSNQLKTTLEAAGMHHVTFVEVEEG